ncbi:MAG: hypothetical protein AAB578_05360 [Elusimicrobiota bacterium]
MDGSPSDPLPGEYLISRGLEALSRGQETEESLLVSIGAARLRRAGISLHDPLPSPESRLYELLRRSGPDSAHSRYNALIRRLVSFERAIECAK